MARTAKFFLGMVVGLTFLAGAAGLALAAEKKLAYVDLSRIFSEYSKTKSYDKTLSDKESSYEAERNKKVEEVKQLQDKVNLLSDKEKEAKKPDLDAKIKTLQEFDRQKQTDLRKEQDEKMKELLKDIEDVIKKYAEKEGYSMVFNNRVLVYEDKTMDITEKIIDLLNKGSKK
ncbi:MAG: OmpH family outer membrane protein [Candidatus Omnitrophica bacterium]|nr:OmpH family outer membrane protein [Candidatus Omnitrophota bacterium]